MPTDKSSPPSTAALPTDKQPARVSGSADPASSSKLKWILVLLPLAYFWFRLINNLRSEWETNPQYAFGWLVPLLCAGLILRKWETLKKIGNQRTESPTSGLQSQSSGLPSPISHLPSSTSPVSALSSQPSFPLSAFRFPLSAFILLAFLYLPTRLIEAATPEWRPIQWLLGLEAVGLTLCAIRLGKGRGWLRQLAFPIAFFMVAIPWPTIVETPIIQALTRMSAIVVIEIMGWVGMPAVAHGNVIEVGTGMVGINEACSGIRSFQSSFMISLFLGEFFRLSAARRWLLVPISFGLAMALNVVRMFLLTYIAATKGVAAIAEYHDPAGVSIAITCTLALWGIAAWLKRRQPVVSSPQSPVSSLSPHVPGFTFQVSRFTSSPLPRLSLALLAWLVFVEAGVQLWYRHLESNLKPSPAWTLNFPRDNPTVKDLPLSADTLNLLRYDEGRQAAWTETDGTRWQVFYCSWLPGRVAGYLAKRHTPEICLQATGMKMLSGPELALVKVKGVELPVRSYVFETRDGPINVFHCRWEAGTASSAYVQQESARFNLIRAVWNGRGNQGQKVLEIIITGMNDPAQARAAMIRQLESLISVSAVESPHPDSPR